MTALDEQRLADALQLAEQAIGVSDPNPRVGCIIGHADGRVLGRGATQAAGGPHAEVMAMREAAAQGSSVQGATAWVTLEPCAHHGRTPPCCEALGAAGIARVVVAVTDPFHRVAGRGIDWLRAHGVDVDVAATDSAIASAARELNIGFFKRQLSGRPWVRLKAAASLDGRTALPDGRSQWITGPAARRDGHAWRRRAGAVLTGVGTVLHDDPRLDVRLVPTQLQPLRVIADSALRTPPSARLMAPPGSVLIATGTGAGHAAAVALRAAGAEVLPCPDGRGTAVDLGALLDELGRRQINEVHVEAGAVLNGALLAQRLVDELLLYVAPMLIGAGRGIADLAPLAALPDGLRFTPVDSALLDGDLRLRLRPATAAQGAVENVDSVSPVDSGHPPNLLL